HLFLLFMKTRFSPFTFPPAVCANVKAKHAIGSAKTKLTWLVRELLRLSIGFALFAVPQESYSQTFTVLYPFGITPDPGYNPEAKLFQASDGNFYGACSIGGHNLPAAF